MPLGLRRPAVGLMITGLVAGGLLVGSVTGCGGGNKAQTKRERAVLPSPYPKLPAAQVPDFMRGTIYDLAVTRDQEAKVVSGFGLVAELRNTGDTTVSNPVREYIIRDMVKRGIDRPEAILADKRVAIVRVEGAMPPGIRKGDHFDVHVSVPESSTASSLAHGRLFQCELSVNGANEIVPGNPVHRSARAQGEIFVNPAHALDLPDPTDPNPSLRYGAILNGGQSLENRPMRLQLRQPQASIARRIEHRIDERFADRTLAAAKDEAIVEFYVPPQYQGDWERFKNVVTHLYMDNRPEFLVTQARLLAEEAVKPDAPLLDISYCWEGIGKLAIPSIQPLLTHPSPDVAFAAARAGAFLEDQASLAALMQMSQQEGHPFQLNAVTLLGKLPGSPLIASTLRRLINSDHALVRLEAYRTLARQKDPIIYSRVVNERFVIDVVQTRGEPLIFATRSGVPRIGVIGDKTKIETPITFSAMDNQFMISSIDNRTLQIYYRGPGTREPIKMLSSNALPEVIARLGGDGAEGEKRLDFSYSEVLGILQALADKGKIVAYSNGEAMSGSRFAAQFVLQDVPHVQDAVYGAPVIQTARRGGMAPDELPELEPDAGDDARMTNQGVRSRPQ